MIPPGETFPPDPPKEGDGVWRWNIDSFNEKRHLIVCKKSNSSPLLDQDGSKAKWNIYTKSYLKDKREKGNIPRDFWKEFLNRHGTSELKKLKIPYDFPKPVGLVKYLMKIIKVNNGEIVLDFFAGSGTTAHAVLELNKEVGNNSRFIMVQLPEKCEDNIDARKAGFQNIADIGKERIRRVINKIKEERAGKSDGKLPGMEEEQKLDLGFCVFKLDKSNFNIWDGMVSEEGDIEDQLELAINHIDSDSSDEDILYEILLKAGFELTTKIQELNLAGKKVYSIANNALLICLERKLTKEVITEMARLQPARVVCLDKGFADNDQLKTNVVQIMKSHDIEDFRTV